MGAPLTEIILERIIRYGLQELRDKPSRIDMIFDKMLLPAMVKQYGNKEIDTIKQYVLNKKIAVVQAWPIQAEKIPCYSINVVGTEEAANTAFFGDEGGYEVATRTAPVLLSTTPLSYDSTTGFLKLSDGTDLSNIYVGAIFTDPTGEEYEILGAILEETGRTGFAIVYGADVTLGSSVVYGAPDYDVSDVKKTPMIENVQIGVHAGEETNLCKYLYYMLLYFIQSRRMELENIGVQLHTFTVSEFAKILDFLPDNVLSRFVTFRAKVWFSWYQDPIQSINRTGVQVKVDKDKWIKTGDYTVLTTDGTEEE